MTENKLMQRTHLLVDTAHRDTQLRGIHAGRRHTPYGGHHTQEIHAVDGAIQGTDEHRGPGP
jgi:hypothetical protein